MKTRDKITVLLALSAAFCWCAALCAAGQAERLTGSLAARWDHGGGMSPVQMLRQETWAKEDRAEDWPELTLWQEEPGVRLSDTGERETTADAVWVFGNCEEVTASRLRAGSYPARSDPEGCAVSQGLALALWGSVDVLGMPLRLNGGIYYVRGVFGGSDPRLLLQKDPASNETMANLQLRFPDGGGRDRAEAFLQQLGMGGGAILDLSLLEWVLGLLTALPAALLALGILLRLVSRALRLRAYPVLLLSYLPLLISGTVLAWICLGAPSIPARVIPTRWSDFDFWKRLLTGLWGHVEVWLSQAPSFWDAQFFPMLLAAGFLILPAAGLTLAAAVRLQVRSATRLLMIAVAVMAGQYAVSLLFLPFGGVAFHRQVYLLPCLWLLVELALYLHQKQITIQRGGEEAAHEEAALDTKESVALTGRGEVKDSALEEAECNPR